MNLFPIVDPIPLPAPVWLFKLLHIVTLALHFIAVETLIGGLIVATVLSLWAAKPQATAAAAMARRLPVVMTYVINLGVPPLLFAQVLYGRALYTSSVLIGAHWISIIPGLMLCYWLLYRFSSGLEKGRKVWWLGFLAFILAGGIARIYSSNMTLMLRPEAWGEMYARSAAGAFLPKGDPTLLPRWAFAMSGGLWMAGLWMLYLSSRRTLPEPAQRLLVRIGGSLSLVMGVVQVAAARMVLDAQPQVVRDGLASNSIYHGAAMAYLGAIALGALLGAIALVRKTPAPIVSWAGVAIAVLASAGMTLWRDGLRDLTLSSKGFDVWQRAVETNWGVVILFLAVFVAGLGAVGWLISVVARAEKPMEGVA